MTRFQTCIILCLAPLCACLCALGLSITTRISAVHSDDIRAISWNLRNGSYDFARTMKTSGDFAEMLSKDYYDPAYPEVGWYWELTAQIQTATTASRKAEEFLENLSAHLLGGRDAFGETHTGTLPLANGILGTFGRIANQTAGYLDLLADAEKSPLKPVADALRDISKITADIQRQTAEGGNIDRSLAAFQAASARLDALLEKSEVAAIIDTTLKAIENGNRTAANMDEATGYIRDMLKPTKQSFWKQLAFKAAGAALPPVVTHLIPQNTVVTNTVTVKPKEK